MFTPVDPTIKEKVIFAYLAEIVESIHFYRLARKLWQDQGQRHDGGDYNGVDGKWDGTGSNSNISNNALLHSWIKNKAFKLDSEYYYY
jgi:hypothetical protein